MKFITALTLTSLFLFPLALAQSDSTSSKVNTGFMIVETKPKLKGGYKSLYRKVKYPEECRRKRIQGKVIVGFIVDIKGKVKDPYIIEGIGGGCDEAAIRAIKRSKFEPGMRNGEVVAVQYQLPIVFRLQN